MPSSHSSNAVALPITPVSPNAQRYPFFRDIPPRRLIVSLEELYANNVGLLLIAASQLFMTFMNISVKFLNEIDDPVPTLELVLVRMFITYCCSITYMIVRKIPHAFLGPPEVRYLLIFRGVSGFFGLFGIYYSLQYLSLSDAVVLTFLSPTTTAIAGFFVLREHLSKKEIAAGAFSFLGVILIARPQSFFGNTDQALNSSDVLDKTVTSAQRIVAVAVSMLGVAGATGAYISLRAIGERAHVMHSLTFFSSYSVIVSTIGMILFRIRIVIPSKWSWSGILLSIGVCGFIGQVLLARGLQKETASRGTLALYTQLLFATVMERLIFGTVPSLPSILGAIIIMSSAIYIAVGSRLLRDHSAISKFRQINRQSEAKDYQAVPQSGDHNAESDFQPVDLENITSPSPAASLPSTHTISSPTVSGSVELEYPRVSGT